MGLSRTPTPTRTKLTLNWECVYDLEIPHTSSVVKLRRQDRTYLKEETLGRGVDNVESEQLWRFGLYVELIVSLILG